MVADTDTSAHDDGTGAEDMFVRHAEYIANTTPATEKQAEAYFRWYMAEDTVDQRELADEMGVTESTFSNHLSGGKTVLDEGTFEGMKTMLAMTPLGGVAGRTERVVATKETLNTFVALSKSAFPSDDRIASDYSLYLVYREPTPDEMVEDLPDDVILYDEWSTFAIRGESADELARAFVHYIDKIDALDDMDEFATYSMMVDAGLDVKHIFRDDLEDMADTSS